MPDCSGGKHVQPNKCTSMAKGTIQSTEFANSHDLYAWASLVKPSLHFICMGKMTTVSGGGTKAHNSNKRGHNSRVQLYGFTVKSCGDSGHLGLASARFNQNFKT